MRAFKAEKGSDFIAAHQPGLYSQQQSAENTDCSGAEIVSRDVHYLAQRMVHHNRSSKILFNRCIMSEFIAKSVLSVMAGNLKHMRS